MTLLYAHAHAHTHVHMHTRTHAHEDVTTNARALVHLHQARVRYTACLACTRLYTTLKAHHLLDAAMGGLVRNLRDGSYRGVQHAAAQALTGLLSAQNPVADRDQFDTEVEKVVEACAHAIQGQVRRDHDNPPPQCG